MPNRAPMLPEIFTEAAALGISVQRSYIQLRSEAPGFPDAPFPS